MLRYSASEVVLAEGAGAQTGTAVVAAAADCYFAVGSAACSPWTWLKVLFIVAVVDKPMGGGAGRLRISTHCHCR